MKTGAVVMDGTELFRWSIEDGVLYREHVSWGEDLLMALNREQRGTAKTLSFGRAAMRMTEAQYHFLVKRFPALKSRDPVEKTKAWQRLANDPDYRDLVVGNM